MGVPKPVQKGVIRRRRTVLGATAALASRPLSAARCPRDKTLEKGKGDVRLFGSRTDLASPGPSRSFRERPEVERQKSAQSRKDPQK
jgi:hypothetical protein